MDIIESIIALAENMDPAAKDSKPTFVLELGTDGVWRARVDYSRYHFTRESNSAADALGALHEAIVGYNRSLLARIRNAISKWSNKGPRLVSVATEQKEGA